MKIRIKILFVFFLVSCLLSLVSVPALAAQLFFESSSQTVAVGDRFEIKVYVNTDDKLVNSVEGKVVFPAQTIVVRDLRDGDSLVSLWVKRPAADDAAKTGEISFAGLLPGGYAGADGFLFSIVFEAKNGGRAVLRADDVRVLLNDGQGTEAGVRPAPFTLSINAAEEGVVPQEVVAPSDTESPVEFEPYVARDKDLYEGKWFLVFATQDKGSGIDHYEVLETRNKRQETGGGWVVAKSPYVLQDQKLKSWIFVKAVDKSGNETVGMLGPESWPLSKWLWIMVMGLLVVVVVAFQLSRKRRQPRFGVRR